MRLTLERILADTPTKPSLNLGRLIVWGLPLPHQFLPIGNDVSRRTQNTQPTSSEKNTMTRSCLQPLTQNPLGATVIERVLPTDIR